MKLRIKRREHGRFYCMLALLLMLVCSRYALQINVPRMLSLAVIALIALCGTQNEIIAMMICLIPLHEMVDFYYSMIIILLVYILKYYRRIKVNLSIILVMIMVLWELLHSLTSEFEPFSLLASLIPMALLAILVSSDIKELDYAFVVNSIAVTTICVCITMLGQVFALSSFNVAEAVSNLRRLGMISEETSNSAITGGAIHPNSLGVICVLVTTGLMQLKTIGKSNKWSIPMVVVLLVFGALTSSRTFVACLLFMVVLFYCGIRGNVLRKLRFLGAVLLIGVLALILLNSVFPELLQYYIGRFFVKDITTGRDDLMIKYHAFIVENNHIMLFGVGVQNFAEKLVDSYRVARHVPHNSIQEIVVAWGIPGLIMFFLLCITLIIYSYRYNKKRNVLNYIPFLVIIFKSMAGQILTSGYSLLALSYAYLSLTQNFDSKED